MRHITVAWVYALWLEVFYKFGATSDPSNFVGAMVIYAIYLSTVWLASKGIWPRAPLLLTIMVFGCIGLAAEWFLIGNAPWSNSDAIQVGMFVFHASYPLLGFVYVGDDRYTAARRFNAISFVVFTPIACVGFLFPSSQWQFAWFIWVPLIPYGLCIADAFFRRRHI